MGGAVVLSSSPGNRQIVSGRFLNQTSQKGHVQAQIVVPKETGSRRYGSDRLVSSIACSTSGNKEVDNQASFVTLGRSNLPGINVPRVKAMRKGRTMPSGLVVVSSLPEEDRGLSPQTGADVFETKTSHLEYEPVSSASSPILGFGEGSPLLALEKASLAMEGSSAGGQVLANGAAYQPKIVWFAKSDDEERLVVNQGINGALVSVAAAAALTKIFTVDQYYWTGWTTFEIIRNAPLHNWLAYEAMLESNPVLAKMMISGVVYTIGDWFAQCYEGRGYLNFDRARMMRSGLVGFCFHGSLSHYYYHFCEWLFPFQGWYVVPLKVAFDQTVWSGVWNSIYFVLLGALRMERPSTIWQELKETFFPLLTAGWKLWPLAHIVTYGVVPVEQRLLWVDMVELVWVTILSMISNEKSGERIAEEAVELLALQEGVPAGAADVEAAAGKAQDSPRDSSP